MNNYNIRQITEWIKQYFQDTNKSKAIVGISGGIDSAVIASLCVNALGKDNVIGVMIPIDNDIFDSYDALEVIKKLDIAYTEINLDREFFDFWRRVNKTTYTFSEINNNRMVKGNIKARMRMTALYALSEMTNGLVVGTTNKTEASIGYATKYGDGGVDIEPIMDFYKTEIFDIAQDLNVPVKVINKKPSAGLWEGQTDEEELGMSYAQIDTVLKYMNKEIIEVPNKLLFDKVYEKVNKLITMTEHKRNLPPYYKKN